MSNKLVKIERLPTTSDCEVLPEFQVKLLEMAELLRRLAVRTPCHQCADWLNGTADRMMLIRNLVLFTPDSRPLKRYEERGDNLMLHGEPCRKFWTTV